MNPSTKPKTKATSTTNENGDTDAGSGSKDTDEQASSHKDANTNKNANTFQQELPQIPVGKTVDATHPLGDHQVRALPGFLQLHSIPEAGSQENLQHLPDLHNLLDAFKRLKSDVSRKQTHGARQSQRFRSKGTRHISLAPFISSAGIPQEKGSYHADPTPTNNHQAANNLLVEQIKRPKLPPSTPVSATAVRWLQETIPRLFTDVRMEAFVYGNLKSYTPQKLASVVSQAMPFRNDTLQRNVCPRSQARVSE